MYDVITVKLRKLQLHLKNFYLPVNNGKPKFTTFLVFVCTTSSSITQISSFKNVSKQGAILALVANSEYPMIFRVTGANQTSRKLLFTDLVNTKMTWSAWWQPSCYFLCLGCHCNSCCLSLHYWISVIIFVCLKIVQVLLVSDCHILFVQIFACKIHLWCCSTVVPSTYFPHGWLVNISGIITKTMYWLNFIIL